MKYMKKSVYCKFNSYFPTTNQQTWAMFLGGKARPFQHYRHFGRDG